MCQYHMSWSDLGDGLILTYIGNSDPTPQHPDWSEPSPSGRSKGKGKAVLQDDNMNALIEDKIETQASESGIIDRK